MWPGCGVRTPAPAPREIAAKLEKRYLATLTASGAAVGSVATFPGIGTLTALSAGAGETVFFLEATALFVLATAEVYGIPADHRERRRALVLAVLVGDDSRRAIGELVGPSRTNGGWLAEGMASLPMSSLARLNTRMLKFAVRRYAIKRGALLMGKMLPVGVGAAVGGVGNRIFGNKIVTTRARRSASRRHAGGSRCICCRQSRTPGTRPATARASRSLSRIADEALAFMGRRRSSPPRV